MKCLSVRQPWAWAIMAGLKRYENRNWTTTHRGPLGIHAGRFRAEFTTVNRSRFDALMPGRPPVDQLTFGAIIGLVDLIEIRPASECPPDPFVEGPFCWFVENTRRIEPVPFAGRLGLFEIPEHLIQIPH